MNSAEPTKLTASNAIAAGAFSRSTTTPASPGPPSWAAARLISSFELPSISCCRSTSDGRYDWYATSKNTVAIPARNATPYSCQIVSCPSPYTTGIEPSSAARATSPTTSIGRRGNRSTQTPAGRLTSRNGRNSTVVSAATSNALAWRTSIAASGSASRVNCVPNWLTVWADQSLTKSGCRQRPPVGQGFMPAR